MMCKLLTDVAWCTVYDGDDVLSMMTMMTMASIMIMINKMIMMSTRGGDFEYDDEL